MQLVIAEKPSVARDLARVLGVRPAGKTCFEGDRHVITWCIGHLVELEEPAAYDPAWKAWRLDTLPMLPPELRLRPAKHARDQLRAVKALLRDRRFTGVVNACDAGREGELIFRYVYAFAGSRLPVQRLWVSSLTDEAIRRGFASLRPGRQLDALGDAARCRSEADWLVGMNATRAVTARGRIAGHETRAGSIEPCPPRSKDEVHPAAKVPPRGALYSIGRVQTPTLAMLVEREQAIRAFVPRPYWEVHGAFRTAAGAELTAKWTPTPARATAGRLASVSLADELVARDRARGAAAALEGPRVEKLASKTVREPPPMLFDLTSLQRTANRRFGWSAQRTLELAQALYERHKIVTYPRTDARHLSTDIVGELPQMIGALADLPTYAPFAQPLLPQPPRLSRRFVDDTKVSDHHAIVPTGKPVREDALDRDELRLFDLIARRFLGAFHPDAEIAVTELVIRVGPPAPLPKDAPEGEPAILDALPPLPDRYVARGRVRLVAGWQDVAGIDPMRRRDDGDAGRDDDPGPELPKLAEGEALDGRFVHVAKQTTPPPRYTEATLLGAMESAGKAIDDEALRLAMKDRGLGTPATRASIIETLIRRGYVERQKQHLVATEFGIGLVDALPVASLRSPELTGSWEARLARVARGEETRGAFMADIARFVTELVDIVRGSSPPPAPAPGWSPAPKWEKGRRGASGRGRSAKAPRAPRAAKAPRAARPPTPAARPAAIDQLTCPRCKLGTLITGSRGWGCNRWKEGCAFVVWFELDGTRVTPAQLKELVTRGKTRKTAAGRLVLDVGRDGGAARRERS